MGLYEFLRDNIFVRHTEIEDLAFIDVEVSATTNKVQDFGAFVESDKELHTTKQVDFEQFVGNAKFLCGHNIIHHDLKYLPNLASKRAIDTLYLSPLLFPKRPYHKLLKDDKLQSDELNNPLNDCLKARDLFYDEINAFASLDSELKHIYAALLADKKEFCHFFDFIEFQSERIDIDSKIHFYFGDRICLNCSITDIVNRSPIELAYALALISTGDALSVTPPWLLLNYPNIENVIRELCNTPCHDSNCRYCSSRLDIHKNLLKTFGYQQFRTFDGEPMQERAVQAAVEGKSLLTIFPTGGGKSLTFQLPALIAGEAMHGLTIVISPLQSLMKDQVDNLEERGIAGGVTINGQLDPVSRADAFEQVANGKASILYISPEMLRSKTIERLLLKRNVVRFVIDEAHCFSSWGHDFRVDYLYIGDFIRKLQEKKQTARPIPVSCFTATAKQKVITDICDYFKRKLNLELTIFASASTRQNLHYTVVYAETEDEKYNILRSLLISDDTPAIVYVSRTKRTVELAEKLNKDGISALAFNGRMESSDKITNQNAFISNEVRVMVATSAFGMGVDKKDVGLVVHFDISDSLENYVQEAGRAGRDPQTQARCYVLYSDHDLDKHFILLNQTKLSQSDIQQVWKAIKDFTRQRKNICCSALEIARQAGWNETVFDIETRVRTAIAALEEAGYVSRGNNVPHIFATGIMVRNMDEARQRITQSALFSCDGERETAVRIIKSLISQKNTQRNEANSDAESRVDYLADILGLTKANVINIVNIMRQDGLLADSQDMMASIETSERQSLQTFERFAQLERFIIDELAQADTDFSYKALNESASAKGISSSVKNIRTLLYFLSVKSYIKKREDAYSGIVRAVLCGSLEQMHQKQERRISICRFIIKRLYTQAVHAKPETESNATFVQFSVTELLNEYMESQKSDLFAAQATYTLADVEDALLYLQKIGALKLEGGFMVVYNAMELHRLKDTRNQYTKNDYRMLDEFYKQKIQQIHIIGEYANLMVRDYNAALQYVRDYFQMDFKRFISKYFKGERLAQIDKNITPEKYNELFGTLSARQREIIDDKQSKYIVVAAGPGSGKTRVLVHKLASLLLLEDVKHEQLLMLTFSRAAATEFKQRLIDLIGNAAHFIEIKTFHAFSFDLLGKVGNLEDAENVVARAAQMIENGEAEQGRINKAVLVIDEAQDMDANEYALVRALMHNNEEMRVIAVGDDDQNIFQFRGSDSRYMQSLINDWGAIKYELTENFRSKPAIVNFANTFVQRITNRMKTTPCSAVNGNGGIVNITHYKSSNLEIPIVNCIAQNYNEERIGVLTNTNYEAAQIVGLLNKRGLRAKLIQSTDGFRFCNLAEVRFFVKQIEKQKGSPIISNDLWNEAKQKTLNAYATSDCISYLHEFWSNFEHINRTKYRSDLADYVFESNLEDFCGNDAQTILVSTIHKAKGREFDTVHILLDGETADTNDKLRKIYVGITRAKSQLHIHTNTDIFGIATNADTTIYQEPDEISLQLTLRDVYLDYFKKRKKQILQLRSGQPLAYNDGYLCLPNTNENLASLSNKCRTELMNWAEKGYHVKNVKICYIVAWRGQDDEEETAVMLPEIILAKKA